MKNALICFLKFPEPGKVKTRLAHDLGAKGSAELYEALAERVITEVYPLNRAYDLKLCIDPGNSLNAYKKWLGEDWEFHFQEGETLGDRMSQAVHLAFGEGYQRVVLIGTDCIGMDEDFIENTFAALDRTDVVIGPSTDGGYYLLATKREYPWLFENMAWSTDVVLETTIDRIEARELKFRTLEEKIDIDTIDDLAQFRKRLPEEHFLGKKIDHIVLERLTPPEGAYEPKRPD